MRRDGKGRPRFHGGIDLKPIDRDKNHEPTDAIFSVMDGEVLYVNLNRASDLGRYVVVQHTQTQSQICTLYAHLREVDVKKGQRLIQGARIGKMGRSSRHGIPKNRAHLHFEMGFLASNHFDSWYNRQFKAPNPYGKFNARNFCRIDPLDCYESVVRGTGSSVDDYVKKQPEAFAVEIQCAQIPDFVIQYPFFCKKNLDRGRPPKAWRVGFTLFGLPVSWTPIENPSSDQANTVRWVSPKDTDLFLKKVAQHKVRHLFRFNKKGQPVGLAAGGQKYVNLLFPQQKLLYR